MKPFSLRSLQEYCPIIEKHLLIRRVVTADELAPYRPGSKNNPGKRSTRAWVIWHSHLVKLCDREDSRSDAAHEKADGIGLDILRAEPLPVTLTALDEDGNVRVVNVYPKSLDALLQCHARDRVLAWLAEKSHALRNSDKPEHVELLAAAMAEISFHYAVLVWIVTTPSPRSPLQSGSDNTTPPDWILDLDPWDFLKIAQAHAVVNAQRLQALEALISKDTDTNETTTRPSWTVFAGDLAVRLNTTTDSIMKDRSLASLLATIKANASVQRDATRAAKSTEPGGDL